MLRSVELALVAEDLAYTMSHPRPQDPGFRAPLRDIVDSIGTGRHIEGIHMYDKDDRRIRQTVFQLPDGLGVFDDDTASEASSGAHTDSVFPEGDDDDTSDDGQKIGDRRRRKSIPCLECERPKRRKTE